MNHDSPPHDDVRVRLAGGVHAMLRPLRSGQIPELLEVFDQLSSESRRKRYFCPMPRLPRSMIDALVAVDGDRHVAWLASVSDRPVGLARYIITGPCTAEIAAEVADAHQGQGLGTALLDAVTTVACVSGVRRIQATVMPDNAPSRRLVARLGVQLKWSGSTLAGEGPLRLLEPPRVDRRAVVSLAAWTRSSADPDGPWISNHARAH